MKFISRLHLKFHNFIANILGNIYSKKNVFQKRLLRLKSCKLDHQYALSKYKETLNYLNRVQYLILFIYYFQMGEFRISFNSFYTFFSYKTNPAY